MNDLTRVITVSIPKCLVVSIRFGHPIETIRRTDGTAHHWFMSSQLFAIAWWARLSPRRQWACFSIVESLCASNVGYRVPCVTPAVKVHMWLGSRCRGNDCGVVTRAEALVNQLKQQRIDPSQVPPAYYRAASQSLRTGHQPRELTLDHLEQYWGIRSCYQND